jgi:hypothetical protein
MKKRFRLAQPLVVLWLLTFLAAGGACSPPGSASTSPVAAARTPAAIACPDGKPPRDGLANFGAYIGTWQSGHARYPQSVTDYQLGQVPGRVEVRCSADDLVIEEQINPRDQTPAGSALRIALTDLPDDARKIYDHLHLDCRTLQYASAKLARQLAADDPDGHVSVTLDSDGRYNPASVTVIRIDVVDLLGGDSERC